MKFENFMKLSRHLGWQDMLSQVAMPAIEEIINNHLEMISDVTGDCFDEDHVVTDLLQWSSDEVFWLLSPSRYSSLTSYYKSMFISLRNEIETEMRSGSSYQEAISEWWK